MTRIGKIARIPHEIREQVNRKLLDGVPGRQIIDWLNTLPEVTEVLDRDFDGREISDQNLTEWKQGGFRQWFAQEEARLAAQVVAGEARELTQVAGGSIADHLATVIATKYAVAIAAWDGQPDSAAERELRTLGEICRTIDQLRRGDHSAARVRLEQARVTFQGTRAEKHIFLKFREWANREGGWKYLFGGEGLAEDQQLARMASLLAGKQPPDPSGGPLPADIPPSDTPPPSRDRQSPDWH